MSLLGVLSLVTLVLHVQPWDHRGVAGHRSSTRFVIMVLLLSLALLSALFFSLPLSPSSSQVQLSPDDMQQVIDALVHDGKVERVPDPMRPLDVRIVGWFRAAAACRPWRAVFCVGEGLTINISCGATQPLLALHGTDGG